MPEYSSLIRQAYFRTICAWKLYLLLFSADKVAMLLTGLLFRADKAAVLLPGLLFSADKVAVLLTG